MSDAPNRIAQILAAAPSDLAKQDIDAILDELPKLEPDWFENTRTTFEFEVGNDIFLALTLDDDGRCIGQAELLDFRRHPREVTYQLDPAQTKRGRERAMEEF
jgi:hypothetical protein